MLFTPYFNNAIFLIILVFTLAWTPYPLIIDSLNHQPNLNDIHRFYNNHNINNKNCIYRQQKQLKVCLLNIDERNRLKATYPQQEASLTTALAVVAEAAAARVIAASVPSTNTPNSIIVNLLPKILMPCTSFNQDHTLKF